MTAPARRRVAAVAAAGVTIGMGVGLATVPPAVAENLGLGWEGRITSAETSGDALRVPVVFQFTGTPGSVITSITLTLVPQRVGATDTRCASRSITAPIEEGDGNGATSPPDVDPSLTPDQDTTVDATHTFAFDPGCNGTYDIEVHATADPGGPAQPGDPGTESQDTVAEAVRVSLAPPAPTGVSAGAAPDGAVTVRWSAPAAWTDGDGATADAAGFRVDRDFGDGTFVSVGSLDVDQTEFVDDDLLGAPYGSYRYRVVALRAGANGGTVASTPGEATVVLAAPTTTTTPPATTPGPGPAPTTPQSGGGRSPLAGGGAATSPALPTVGELDPEFDPELDYSQFDVEQGAEEAVTPADASGLEVVFEDPVGAGLAVPFAVFACLTVWAAHLRHLSRRALTPPT